ncbi:hypothetical protein GH714_014616 [Hevea brasiliensis]|uniref:RING-type domain-containing protein n=1 Tax=Hevea brasiliensis TaxID=3981 RepID=A0A6A6MDW4_HEVBR|nr:hypothetical protein GH714_014616 [Hevea brasiliensis]
MGKRKRTSARHNASHHHPSSSDDIPCSSGAELLATEKSSHLLDSSELKPLSPGRDATDSTMKLLNVHSSLAHQHYNVGLSIFLKRSRHFYGHQYSRRNSGNHANASTSHGKIAPLRDERLPFKLSGSEFGHQTDYKQQKFFNLLSLVSIVSVTWDSPYRRLMLSNTDFIFFLFPTFLDNREKAFGRPDRIRLSSLVMDASDAVKIVCGICQKLLRRKPYFLGETLSGECSVVAVLVCGHVYHADCLEQRTSLEDKCDPPCPLCLGQEDKPE